MLVQKTTSRFTNSFETKDRSIIIYHAAIEIAYNASNGHVFRATFWKVGII